MGKQSLKENTFLVMRVRNELKELIQKINPTKIIPIHTLKPENFENLFEEKIIRPTYAEPIELMC